MLLGAEGVSGLLRGVAKDYALRVKRLPQFINLTQSVRKFESRIVFSVFRPFGELSYKEAVIEISTAIKSITDNLDK